MSNKPAVADHLRTTTNLYFIGSPDGPIKIGISRNPPERLMALQVGHHNRLSVILSVPAHPSLERVYHKRFKAHRLSGEWFNRCAEIEHEILRLDPTAMERIDQWADLAGDKYGCAICGPFPCRSFVHNQELAA